jgi:SPP1 gp7 family putative phage head morphogenesis protein
MLDENGNKKSWQDFKTEVLKIHKDYNVNWLKTEYNTAAGSAQAAKQWTDLTRDKADVLLKYVAVHDDRTRTEHRAWDGITLPANHPFWQTHFPPNGWNCRCTAIPVSETATPTPPDKVADTPPVDLQFAFNPAITGELFSPFHPYYEANALQQAIADGLPLPTTQQMRTAARKIQYNNYPTEQWQKVFFDKKTGGYVVRQMGAKNQQKELDAAKIIAQNGNTVELLKAGEIEGVTYYDANVNNIATELKKQEGGLANFIQRGYKDAIKQRAKWVVFEIKNDADVIELNIALKYSQFLDIKNQIEKISVIFANKLYTLNIKEDGIRFILPTH